VTAITTVILGCIVIGDYEKKECCASEVSQAFPAAPNWHWGL